MRVKPQPETTTAVVPNTVTAKARDAMADCLVAMVRMDMPDHQDGSKRLFAAACRCVEHDLTDAVALATKL